MMTSAQSRFVELEKQKKQVEVFYQDLQAAIAAIASEIGINGYFQDGEGTVYKIVEPDGKFVHFEKISYLRTRRPDETRGSLSLKEAETQGFVLSNK